MPFGLQQRFPVLPTQRVQSSPCLCGSAQHLSTQVIPSPFSRTLRHMLTFNYVLKPKMCDCALVSSWTAQNLMRCLKLSKYSVISWIRTYLNRRLPHLIFKIRLCLILKSGHFLEVTSICHKQFLEAMPLRPNPGPFDQAPVDVSGFTSGPCRGQGRKEGDSWDHTLSPDLPE